MATVEEYRMWIDELAARERTLDNYQTGDLVMTGTSLEEAKVKVEETRKARCGRNQVLLLEASTLNERIAVIRRLLIDHWKTLETRPESVVPRIIYALERESDEDATKKVKAATEAIEARGRALIDAGVQPEENIDLFSPQNSMAEIEVQRAMIKLGRVQNELNELREEDDCPDLEEW